MQGSRKMIINIKEEDEEFDPSLLDMDKFRKEISPPPSLRSFNFSNETNNNNNSNKKRSRQSKKENGKKKQNNKSRKKENSIFFLFKLFI